MASGIVQNLLTFWAYLSANRGATKHNIAKSPTSTFQDTKWRRATHRTDSATETDHHASLVHPTTERSLHTGYGRMKSPRWLTSTTKKPTGPDKPTSYWSKLPDYVEHSCNTMNKECPSLVWTVLILRPYAKGALFTIPTDEDSLH